MTLVDILKQFEGYRPTPYICPGGYKTIGYGHLIKPGELFQTLLTPDDAHQLLLQDINDVEYQLSSLIKVSLNLGQRDALISFIFNVGLNAFQRSTMRRKINREDHDGAIGEFIRWIWAGGRKMPGLYQRRCLEADIYRGAICLKAT